MREDVLGVDMEGEELCWDGEEVDVRGGGLGRAGMIELELEVSGRSAEVLKVFSDAERVE